MTWTVALWLLAGALWALVVLLLALLIGKSIRLADQRNTRPRFSAVHNHRMTHATPITPAFIGAGELVHALIGSVTQEQTRGAGIELDSLCGARRRQGSRSMHYPGVTVKGDGVAVTCLRCDAGMKRRAIGPYRQQCRQEGCKFRPDRTVLVDGHYELACAQHGAVE